MRKKTKEKTPNTQPVPKVSTLSAQPKDNAKEKSASPCNPKKTHFVSQLKREKKKS